MTSRHQKRVRAYRYIVRQAKKLSYVSGKALADVGYISLDELAKLKEGAIGPPPELVNSLKKLFDAIASEAEIDDYLVTPFLPEARHSSGSKSPGRSTNYADHVTN